MCTTGIRMEHIVLMILSWMLLPGLTELNSSVCHSPTDSKMCCVLVNAFKTVGNGDKNYIDKRHGYGGPGAITCDVHGEHLTWFETVLRAARHDPSIKDIFVESQVPIIQPVRSVLASNGAKCAAQIKVNYGKS